MEKKEIKKEGPDYTGSEFLLKNDQKHLDLLAELNKKIKLYDNTDVLDVNYEKRKEELIQFINDHYKTFIARLQAGLPISKLKGLLIDENCLLDIFFSVYNNLNVLRDPLKFIDEAKNRGLIFAICRNKDDDMMYIIDPKKECEKTIKSIKEVNDNVKRIKVIAPGKNMVEEALGKMLTCSGYGHDLTLLPINEVCFSCISSRQTKAVENCCKVINSFTEGKTNEKMYVTLEGESQGVDFITKMVGSTHDKENTRLKNANIELNIEAPHRWQDEQKIVNRLINGAKNNNTITNININNAMGEWIHPTCKTDNLIAWLENYQKKFNNNVKIQDLRTLWSDQQNTLN